MYCDKLINIVQHKKSVKYDINKTVVESLDQFIRLKTTLRERSNLNPYKFSIEENILQETAIMTFVIGVKCGIFKPKFYYNCYCGEQFEVIDVYNEVLCTCEKIIHPNEHKDRLFLYFQLLEKPILCNWKNESSLLPLDHLEKVGYGTGNFTLADVDRIGGRKIANDLIGERASMYERFLEEER